MALDTYANLQTSIGNWLNRSDIVAVIPDFITLAEAQMSRRLLVEGPIRNMMAKAAVTYSTEYSSLPSDFMGLRSLYLNGSQTLQIKPCQPEQITEKKSNTTQLTGDPDVVALVGSQLQLFPAPTTALTGELIYWQRVPALSSGNTTNWLLTLHPDAYLYGSLLQAAPYLKNDERIAVWGDAFQTILADIVAAAKVENLGPYLDIPDVTGGTP